MHQNTARALTSWKRQISSPAYHRIKKKSNTHFISDSNCLTFLTLTHKKNAPSTHHFKATGSRGSTPTIVIITRNSSPQICTVARINHGRSLQGPTLRTDRILQFWPRAASRQRPNGAQSISQAPRAELIERHADKTWCTWLADVTGKSGLMTDTFIGLESNVAAEARPNGAESWHGISRSSKPDKRLLCLGRQQ